MTRQQGVPCIFFGDYYGLQSNNISPLNDELDILLKARRDFAYGWQHDYFDDAHIVGWTSENGLAALISNGNTVGSKKMFVGEELSGNKGYFLFTSKLSPHFYKSKSLY